MKTPQKFSDLSPGQQAGMLVTVSIQFALAATAWADLAKRPASQVRGRKVIWGFVIAVNWIGPISYFIWGRRRG